MKSSVQKPGLRLFGDLRIGAVLLAILAVACGVATLIESHYAGVGSSQTGRAAAYDLVYDAPWFNTLLAVLFLNLLFNLINRLRRGMPALGFLLVHLGVLIILVGAGLTRWYGFEGYLHIREGESNDVVTSADLYVQVRTDDQRAEYPVRLYRPGLQSIARRVALQDRQLTLGVAEYWPRYERVMKQGEGGLARVTLGVMEQDGLAQHILDEGDERDLAGVPVRFLRGGLPPVETEGLGHGVLRVRAGAEACRLHVHPKPGHLGTCGGWVFELIDYKLDHRPHDETGLDRSPRRPMIRVVVCDPTGESATVTLVANDPHPVEADETNGLLRQVNLIYERRGGIDLAKEDGQIVMRASFPMEWAPMTAGVESRIMAAGEVVPLVLRTIYRTEDGTSFVPTKIESSLVPSPAHSPDPGAPAAARLYIVAGGQRVEAVCVQEGAPQRVELDGQAYWLAYGRVPRTLLYSLYLEEFRLETYPGSDNPSSFESHVLLNDPARGITDRPVRIWMNNPLNHRGAKHFQSSYDRDRQGTVLSVNRDPGKNPTYVGYTVFTLGFVLALARALGKAGKRRRTSAIMAGLIALGGLMGWSAQPASAAEAPHDHGPPRTLQLAPEVRETAARLIVQDFRGRMKPLDTLARESVLKITRKAVFEGHDPVELFLAFAVLPSQWYHHPIVAVVDPGVKDLLGINRDRTHVALATLLSDGLYRLQDDVELAHRTEPGHRSRTQRQLLRFDERVHLMYGALLGSSLRIYPIPDDPGDTWGGIQAVLESLTENDPRFGEFEAAARTLFLGLESGDQPQIIEGLRLTRELQRRYGTSVKPSPFRIGAELQLNRLNPFRLATMPYLAGFAVLIAAYFVHLFRRREAPWTFRHPLYALGMLLLVGGFALHVYGFTLRWIASARAPLSNAHESLLWVALAVALAGLIFELKSRTAASGALGSLLAAGVLGVSTLGAFDPAIGPLQPVLASYWLIIHVTVITASYGFFALCCLLGLLTMTLMIIARLRRRPVAAAIAVLDRDNVASMMVGLGLLSVGTLLGGVWANESWGRYWGWDPKETWALVSILVYALILHFRWIPRLAMVYTHAAWSFMAIWVIIMTYFGVNHLLSGLHSYGAGEASRVPGWVVLSFVVMAVFTFVGYVADRKPAVRRQ